MNSIALSSSIFVPFRSTYSVSALPSRVSFSVRANASKSKSKSTAAAAAAAAAPAPAEAPARKPRGITKPKPVSAALQAVVGVKEIPRTQALKQIWAYIKENNLQDPENKKIIICDEKLKGIFAGKDRVGFLEISGLLNPHFLK